MSRRHSEKKVKREHRSKDDQQVPKVAKLDDVCTLDNGPVAKGKRKKRKVELANQGVCQDKEENSGLEEIVPGRKGKKRKQKAEVETDVSEDTQIKGGKDAAAGDKSRQKKRKRTDAEDDGTSDQSAASKKSRRPGPGDKDEDKAAKTKKVKKKKKNRKAPPEATKNTRDQCLQYLKDWQSPYWKFCKNKQLWLLTHSFEKAMIPEEDFEILLRYIEGLKGAARGRLQQAASKFLETANEDNDADDDVDASKYERARLILQMLD